MVIKYYISNRDGEISIFEMQENQLKILKRDGENSQLYDYEEFWNWWEHKTVYKNEEVSFIVVTDNDWFKIPDNVNISDKNVWKSKEIEDIKKNICFNQKILFFPEVKNTETPLINKNKFNYSSDEKTETIQAYFLNKTQVTK